MKLLFDPTSSIEMPAGHGYHLRVTREEDAILLLKTGNVEEFYCGIDTDAHPLLIKFLVSLFPNKKFSITYLPETNIENKKMENTTKLFTAAEARKLAGRSLDEKIASLLETIKKIATNKGRQCKTGWQHKEDDDLWVNGGYDIDNKDWAEAKRRLEDLGYKVSFYYSDGSAIAVDMYTLIEW